MRSDIESLWVFAVAAKCRLSTQDTFAWPLLIILALAWLAVALLYWGFPGGPAWGKYTKKWGHKRIPGPRGLPVIGSMSLMTSPLAHRRIAEAAESWGAKRLMAFSLGDTRVIVTCNPDVAREILHSSVFADRPVKESAYRLMFNRAIGFAPYGVYWRTLRRIAANHLFSPKQIRGAEPQRGEIAAQMVEMFSNYKRNEISFGVKEVLKRASLSNMMCSIFGKNYRLDCANEEVEELKTLVERGYDLLGTLNWSDHLSWVADFDPQKVRSRCSSLVPRVNRFVGQIISDHRAEFGANRTADFVDVLLSLEGNDKLSESDMVAVLWEMIFRGTDTVAVLVEWILARMVVHEEVQARVQDELDRVVGRSRVVKEEDVAELAYLQAVIKEVLRLHPPGPLLSWARLAITHTTIDGYHVPKGTMAMVNMWAISHDPDSWSDPELFIPDRFMPGAAPEFSVLGSDLRLAPFGSGRRTCPGKTLGFATVSFWVASLLQEFKWSPADEDAVDLSEVLRLSCEMAKPLNVKVAHRRR